MPLQHFCITCKRTMDESNFYSSYNTEKYPTGKLDECKKCCTMQINNFDQDTFMPVLREIDIPYVPEEWMKIVRAKCKDPTKVTGMTVLGRYISIMRLKQWRDFRFADTDYLREVAEKEKEQALQRQGYDAAEIDKYLNEVREANDERPPKPPIESLAGMAAEYQQPTPSAAQAPVTIPNMPPPPQIEEVELTEEDKKYLFIKWGQYRPDQWVKLEQMYEDFCNSYDIQSAGHTDTLKLICKTSLKANELIDYNDIEGFQKMSRVYDSLMKSGKFTAQQNKGESNNFVDSVSELVTLCEEEGYIERYHIDNPKDKADQVLWDIKGYLRTLVMEEMNLSNLIEQAAQMIAEDKANENATESDEDLVFDPETQKEENYFTEEVFDEFNEFIEEQRRLDQENEGEEE